jgi:hypothetical protein
MKCNDAVVSSVKDKNPSYHFDARSLRHKDNPEVQNLLPDPVQDTSMNISDSHHKTIYSLHFTGRSFEIRWSPHMSHHVNHTSLARLCEVRRGLGHQSHTLVDEVSQ